jgi:succinate dehydrogenase / fumarate reductase, flavoprotein subunit
MADKVGPFRTDEKLVAALEDIGSLKSELGLRPAGHPEKFDLQRLEWFDLRNMLTVAYFVTMTALGRDESRGAHQREDYPAMQPQWQLHQCVRQRNGELHLSSVPAKAPALAS